MTNQPVDYKGIGNKVLAGIEWDAQDWEQLALGAKVALQKYPNVPHNDRDDVGQETLTLIFRNVDTFRDAGCTFITWFYRQVRASALHWIRAARTKKRAGESRQVGTYSMHDSDDDEQRFDADAHDTGHQTLENREYLGAIRERLATAEDSRLVKMFDLFAAGFRPVDIAKQLGMNAQRVQQLQIKMQEIAVLV